MRNWGDYFDFLTGFTLSKNMCKGVVKIGKERVKYQLIQILPFIAHTV
jgi:hypothetical protein